MTRRDTSDHGPLVVITVLQSNIVQLIAERDVR